MTGIYNKVSGLLGFHKSVDGSKSEAPVDRSASKTRQQAKRTVTFQLEPINKRSASTAAPRPKRTPPRPSEPPPKPPLSASNSQAFRADIPDPPLSESQVAFRADELKALSEVFDIEMDGAIPKQESPIPSPSPHQLSAAPKVLADAKALAAQAETPLTELDRLLEAASEPRGRPVARSPEMKIKRMLSEVERDQRKRLASARPKHTTHQAKLDQILDEAERTSAIDSAKQTLKSIPKERAMPTPKRMIQRDLPRRAGPRAKPSASPAPEQREPIGRAPRTTIPKTPEK
jgi:hypothetical protein